MKDFETFKEQYKVIFPSWTEEQIEKRAKFMSEKYSTIKKGPNVIHLEYFHGLLTDSDIEEIDQTISTVGLELSRFDKNGIMYASLEDFMLQVSLTLSNPTVSNILLGIGSGALWDAIKNSTFLIWKRIKERAWVNQKVNSRPLNFGLHVQVDENTSLDLKLDGQLSEENILKALDKAIDLIKTTKRYETKQRAKFITTDLNGEWKEINVDEELRKKITSKNN